MAVLPPLVPVLAGFCVAAVDGQHLGFLAGRGFRRQSSVNAFKDRVRNAERHVASLVARVAFSDDKNARLAFKKFAHFVGA